MVDVLVKQLVQEELLEDLVNDSDLMSNTDRCLILKAKDGKGSSPIFGPSGDI